MMSPTERTGKDHVRQVTVRVTEVDQPTLVLVGEQVGGKLIHCDRSFLQVSNIQVRKTELVIHVVAEATA